MAAAISWEDGDMVKPLARRSCGRACSLRGFDPRVMRAMAAGADAASLELRRAGAECVRPPIGARRTPRTPHHPVHPR